MQRIIQQTEDGYNTLYIPEMDEHYHSVKGACTESEHIFINMGLKHCNAEQPRILEIGFGTGLNAILTAIEAEKEKRSVTYHTLEMYPLESELTCNLGYETFMDDAHAALFRQMHDAEWEKEIRLTPYFTIKKIQCDFTKEEQWNKGNRYDLVYFDAFAPEKQPEMWTDSIFHTIYDIMDCNGILVTYCAKGCVRRELQSCGFKVERLPGPPNGKREILRATK